MSDHAASAEQTGITPAGSSKQPRFPDGWNWDETAWALDALRTRRGMLELVGGAS